LRSSNALAEIRIAAEAIAALNRLLFENRLWQGMRSVPPAQSLHGDNVAAGHRGQWPRARFLRLAVDQYRATAALLDPTAEPGPHQPQLIPQHGE
jgi:hypothetical protein